MNITALLYTNGLTEAGFERETINFANQLLNMNAETVELMLYIQNKSPNIKKIAYKKIKK